MNLLIFLDLTDNRHAKISNFTLFKGKMSKFSLFLLKPRRNLLDFIYYPRMGTCIPGLHWKSPPCLWPMPCAGQQAKFSVGSKSHTSECLVLVLENESVMKVYLKQLYV